MRIVSWNVNGLRSAVKKGLWDKIEQFQADIIGIQEVRAQEEQIIPLINDFLGYHLYFNTGLKPGYSGVALFSKTKPKEVISELHPDFDVEGRFQAAVFENFCVINAYFPNGAGKDGDNSRVPYKLAFYDEVKKFMAKIELPIFVIGDFNTAHQEIDLARPKENQKTSGFLPEERLHFSHFLNEDLIDTFRSRVPEGEHYSWWNLRTKARERNVGWRIDYVLACKKADLMVKDAFIWPQIEGSDHCPVGVDLKV